MTDCDCTYTAADIDTLVNDLQVSWAEVAELKRKLAKAVQAMQEAIKLADMPHYGDRENALDNCFDAIVLLRTTLSELNGDKT